jgi:hypothetical protein
MESDWELNTKDIVNFISFLTGIYLPPSDQRFRHYSFFSMTRLLKTAILDRLQQWKEIKIRGCLGGIISLSWIPKCCTALSAFHRLLTQPHRTHGLEVTEFSKWQHCWNLSETAQQLERIKFWRLVKSETPGFLNTNPLDNSLYFLMVHYLTPNGQRLMS